MLASVLIAALLLASCASAPAPAPVHEASPMTLASGSVDAVAEQVPPREGTAIKVSPILKDQRARGERSAIEDALVLGSPAALERAREMLPVASTLKEDEVTALGFVLDAVDALVYASDRAAKSLGAGVPARLGGASALLAKAAVDAFAGRVDETPPDYEASGLGELVPGLALFGSSSRDTARQALEAIDRFAGLGIASVIPGLALGLDAERRLDWNSALKHYTEVLDLGQDAWPARLGRGRALLALGRPVEALASLEPLADAGSSLKSFVRPFAEALYENARYAQADQFVSRALVDDPQDSRFILIRAHLLARSRSWQQAMPLLDAYGTVDASNRLFLLLRCLVSEGLRDRDDAMKWARRGLALYPDDPELLVAAARLLFNGPASGREESRILAARAYELTPQERADGDLSPVQVEGRAEAAFEAASLLTADAAARYAWGAAAKYLERAKAYGVFADKALAAMVLRRSGNLQAAMEYASSWYRDRPESESAAEAYLRALVDSGNPKAAQDLMARLLQAKATPPFRSFIHYLQSTLQKTDDAALGLLRTALVENANNQEALTALSDIQFRRKDFAKARFYVRQALAASPDDPELLRRQRDIEAAAGQ